MTPDTLFETLRRFVEAKLDLAVMIWGPPGVGKSAVVRDVAEAHRLLLVDVRLSQLAPTDLRGLPVPDGDRARWLPPEFLPRDGAGILLLDEINLAPPTVQGIAQQLVLDRCVGAYRLPPGWFVWAAGNRREDRSAAYEMPAPLANRFLHLTVEPDLEAFLRYATRRGLPALITSFLAFRPSLLHRSSPGDHAWPSPRSWEMAARLASLGMPLDPAIGEPAALEVEAFRRVFGTLPSLDAIVAGQGDELPCPEEASARYALVFALIERATNVKEAVAAFTFVASRLEAEWGRLFAGPILQRMRARKLEEKFIAASVKEPHLVRFLADYQELMASE